MHQDPNTETPTGRIVGMSVALAAVLAVIVLAFSWPSVTADPRDLPLAITGPEPAVAALTASVEQTQPGAVSFTTVADREAAIDAIRTREVYGAVVLGAQPEVLTASAGSPVVAQLMNGIAGQLQRGLQAQAGGSGAPAPVVTVTDVVPLSTDDPRGTGFVAALFPLLLGGMIGGIGISLAIVGALRRVLAVTTYAVVGGIVLTAIMQSWFGSLQGNWWLNATAIAFTVAAIAAPITGLVALIGRPGIALGPVLFMLIANPISGANIPPQFLPWVWGAIGQWFPPGASATLLRSLSYFPDASTVFGWLVLAGWAAAGLVLSVLGHARTGRTVASSAPADAAPVPARP
jgi:hypothetical protein